MNNPRRIGILGGGQLARMMALAGYRFGLEFVFYDPEASACAGQIGELIVGKYSNQLKLEEFCKKVDVITIDFENVPVETLRFVQKRKPVFPSPEVLEIAQDRLAEKEFFKKLNIPTTDYYPVNSRSELVFAAKRCDYDAFLKTRRMGYDGKGQVRIDGMDSLSKISESFFKTDLIIEKRVAFIREVSAIVVRNKYGEMKSWPLCENKHKDGMLTTTMAPAKKSKLDHLPIEYARKIAEKLDYIGVLVVEFFQTENEIFVNEMAPRVHNSGHWTIEGAHTSQFENHIRAGLGVPLGSTKMNGVAAMLNWIGEFPVDIMSIEGEKLYWHRYGKSPRVGRKIGHTTLIAPSAQELHDRIVKLVKKLGVHL
ncbi:MAG: 5-(carboxyamino)imidazole ribonucleotide synthase [Proteobacteria bacterium]|nr:5-(carboxyamino)imidazole ribonucleotide synthase [Pseudomonadota bacterium]